MKKTFIKWLCVVLAVLVVFPTTQLLTRAISAPPADEEPIAPAPSNSPIKVELTSDKDTYSLLNKMEFTATITNTSGRTVNNISAAAVPYNAGGIKELKAQSYSLNNSTR